MRHSLIRLLACVWPCAVCHPWEAAAQEAAVRSTPLAEAMSPDVWRRERRIIDLHQHIEARPERFHRAAKILDEAGVGIGVILGAGTVTPRDGGASDFERAKQLSDSLYPGRFVNYMLLDYQGWDESDWSERAAKQIDEDAHGSSLRRPPTGRKPLGGSEPDTAAPE